MGRYEEGNICPTCNGSGEGMADGTWCRRCGGSGEVPTEEQEAEYEAAEEAAAASAMEDAWLERSACQ